MATRAKRRADIRRGLRTWLRGFSVLACLSGGVLAQRAEEAVAARGLADLPLEELMTIEIPIVSAASRHAEKSTDAPAWVTIVTAEEIRRYGWRTLADVLRATTGFYTSYDFSYDYVGTRGFLRPGDLNARFLLLVDGHRVNDNIYGQALFGTEGVIDLDLVERIEIVRGPASALYGTSAYFGTVSVVTRAGDSLDGVEASVGARSGDTYEAAVAFGTRFASGADLVVSLSGGTSDGQRQYYPEFDAPETGWGVTDGTDDDVCRRVFAKLSWSKFSVEILSSRREKGIPTAAWGMVFDDARARTVDRWSHLTLGYRTAVGERWDLEARVGVDDSLYKGTYPSPVENGAAVVNTDVSRGNAWTADVRLSAAPGHVHALTIGAEYRDDWRQDQRNFDQDPYALAYDKHGSSNAAALFVQDKVRLGTRSRLDLGIRHDRYSSFGGTTNPRLALVFIPRPHIALKAIYGAAFRAPTGYELFFAPDRETGNYEVNTSLRPEKIATAELAGEWYASAHVRVAASLFSYEVQDLVSIRFDDESGFEVFENGGDVTSTGAEAELAYAGDDGTLASFGYATATARDARTDARLTNSPRHLVRLRASRPFRGQGLIPALELQWESERLTRSGGSSGDRFLVSATVSGRLSPRLGYGAGVTNLLDRRYGDPGAEYHTQETIPQRGGNYWITLRWFLGQPR